MHSFTLATVTPSYSEFFLTSGLCAASAAVAPVLLLVVVLVVVLHPATIKTEQKMAKTLAFMRKLPIKILINYFIINILLYSIPVVFDDADIVTIDRSHRDMNLLSLIENVRLDVCCDPRPKVGDPAHCHPRPKVGDPGSNKFSWIPDCGLAAASRMTKFLISSHNVLDPRSEPVLGTPGIEDGKASIQTYCIH